MPDTQEEYQVEADGVPARVKILEKEDEYVLNYHVDRPEIDTATEAVLQELKEKIVKHVNLSTDEFVDSKALDNVKDKFREEAMELLEEELPKTNDQTKDILIGNLIHEMLGLGDIEIVLNDENLEEIVINGSDEPAWVYHKEDGWLKTNIEFEEEDEIYNYASEIGRRVGKNISSLHPLLDAHLSTGDRTNATLYPISTQGNTITIRKFARDPWTITDFIANGTIDREVAAFLWLCLQYELNILVSGGTGAGKCLTPNSKLTMDNGSREEIQTVVERNLNNKEEIEDGWKADSSEGIISMNSGHDLNSKDAKKVWKREAPEKMYRIRTESGREIEATPEHPFFVNEKGPVEKLRADQLKKKHSIPSPRKIEVDNENQSLEIRNWVEEKENLQITSENEDIQINSTRGKKVKIPEKVNEKLARIAGLVAGDGHIHKKQKGSCRVELHNSNPEILEDFRKKSEKLFNVTTKTERREERVNKTLFHSYVLTKFFEEKLEISPGKKSGKIKIPEKIVKSDNKALASFFKGYFEAEAHVNVKKSNIEITSKSQEIIEQTATGLKRFGIFSRFKHKEIEAGKYYRLIIGPDSLNKFKDNIGFISEEKTNALNQAIKGSRNSNRDLIPSGEVLRKSKETACLYDRQIAEKAGISRRAVSRYIDGSRTPSRTALEKITEALKQRKKELKEIEEELEKLENQTSGKSREEVRDNILGGIKSDKINRKQLEQCSGISSGLISYWKKGTVPGPAKLEKVSLAANQQGLELEYKSLNYREIFSKIKSLRKELKIGPTEIKEELGIDIGVYENQNSTETDKERVNKIVRYLKQECQRAREKLPEELDGLEKITNKDIWWDKVKEIEVFEPETDWVYDLTVPENHTFVADDLIAHNTSLLNVLMPFIPPNQRVLSIEDTREVSLPEFLHWVPLTTREPNPEGKGGVSMLDLLVNALRMRPDRILVGEIRKKQQAEVLFEAMHTGHSVYSTLHADTAEQTVRRLVNPPIDVPKTMVDAVDVNVVMFRDRRRNFRRAMEVAEITENEEDEIDADVIYEWQSKEDEIEKKQESQAIYETLKLHAGMTREEMNENIEEKKDVLRWMEENDVNTVDGVGQVIAEYYSEKENVMELVENDMDPEELDSSIESDS